MHCIHAVLTGLCSTDYAGPDMCIKIKQREQKFDAQDIGHIPANQAIHRLPDIVSLPLKRLLAFLQHMDTGIYHNVMNECPPAKKLPTPNFRNFSYRAKVYFSRCPPLDVLASCGHNRWSSKLQHIKVCPPCFTSRHKPACFDFTAIYGVDCSQDLSQELVALFCAKCTCC